MAGEEVTDPELLRRLNSSTRGVEVTDPELLSRLNSSKKENKAPKRLSFLETVERAMGIESQKTPMDFARNLLYGALKSGLQGAEAISQAGANKEQGSLFNKTIGRPGKGFKYEDVSQYIEPIKSPKPNDWQQNLAQGLGSYLPYGLLGGSTLPGQIAAGAAHGYATSEPNQENLIFPQGKTGSALESGLLNTVIGGAGKAANALRPSVMFRGNLSPEELTRNLAITRGTETGLGDVIGSPFLKKKLENTLTAFPFSGANESLQKTGKDVVNRGENILQNLLGKNDPNKVPEIIYNDLNKQFKLHQQNKNKLYDTVDKLADESNLKLDLPNFSKNAQQYSDAIESTNVLKHEPDSAFIFNRLKNYKNPVVETKNIGSIVDQQGNPIINESIQTYPTLKEANLLKGKLNEYARTFKQSPDPAQRSMARIFGDLASSLKNDIKNTISESGNKALKKAYESAEKNYAQNFSPFLDKEIYKYIGGNANPEDMINTFVKTKPTADIAKPITQVAKSISPESRTLLSYSYLSRALDNEGNLNPAKLSTAIEKLKPNQFKALFPDQNLRKQLKDYTKFEHMNKEAQYLMFNPKTGQRNADILATGLLTALGGIAKGDLIGAIGVPTGAILGGKAATKALTSEKFRESLVNEMLKNRTKYTKITRAAQAGAQGAKKELLKEYHNG